MEHPFSRTAEDQIVDSQIGVAKSLGWFVLTEKDLWRSPDGTVSRTSLSADNTTIHSAQIPSKLLRIPSTKKVNAKKLASTITKSVFFQLSEFFSKLFLNFYWYKYSKSCLLIHSYRLSWIANLKWFFTACRDVFIPWYENLWRIFPVRLPWTLWN